MVAPVGQMQLKSLIEAHVVSKNYCSRTHCTMTKSDYTELVQMFNQNYIEISHQGAKVNLHDSMAHNCVSLKKYTQRNYYTSLGNKRLSV